MAFEGGLMDYKHFTKKELVDILDLIYSTVTCRTEDDVIKIVTRIKTLVEADNGICAVSNPSFDLMKVVNIDYPTEWMAMYAAGEYYKHDPIVNYNYTYFKTHLWKEAIEVFNKKQYIDLMNKASDFGLNYGLASGINGAGQSHGSIFSFSGEKNRFKEHHKKVLDIITPHLHQALVRVCNSSNKIHLALSLREKEVLNWMKEGKTNWEIAIILNISERTVKFHVQNIERKLNAVNKAHAIAIAMDNGLVL